MRANPKDVWNGIFQGVVNNYRQMRVNAKDNTLEQKNTSTPKMIAGRRTLHNKSASSGLVSKGRPKLMEQRRLAPAQVSTEEPQK